MRRKPILAFLMTIPITYAVGGQEHPKTQVRCGGTCERTFYRFTQKPAPEPINEEYKQNAHPEKGWTKVKDEDRRLKRKINEDAQAKLDAEAAKLQGLETGPCKDANGQVDEKCECKTVAKPKANAAGWLPVNPLGEKESGELSFPESFKGGGGVDVTVRYKIKLKIRPHY